jgi:hypothetical protein
VATDNGSEDGTAEILERYERAGVPAPARAAYAVVANAGTILLDALVNDRRAVCVLYDEGPPPGESWAAKNVIGKHYEELAASGAFYPAESFDEVVAGLERALEHPAELAQERHRVVEDVVGEVDGRAGRRVVDAIVGVVPA